VHVVLFFVLAPMPGHAGGGYTALLYYYRSFDNPEPIMPAEKWTGDSIQLAGKLQESLSQLHALGYLNARYRLYQVSDSICNIQFASGAQFTLAYLGQGNLPETMLNKVHYRQKFFREKAFSYRAISSLLKEIIDYSEQNGYPFASVRLDSVGITGSRLHCQIRYESGPLIVFDSVRVEGTDDLKEGFMMAQLGMYKSRPYDQQLVDQIPARISAMSYIRLNKPPSVVYKNGKATIIVDVRKRKVNEVDGIVGLLPNETADSKLLITGQATIDLHNLFASGKHLFVEWVRVQPETQSLELAYAHPKLLRSPIDLGASLFILKQDTSFINRNFTFELDFVPGINKRLGVATDFRSSRIISTATYLDNAALPSFADFNMTYYGLQYEVNTLDDPLFPRLGSRIALSAMAGQKRILKNAAFDDALYTGLDLNSGQYKMESEIDLYRSLGKNLVFKARLSAGLLAGDNLFVNDLFRLGGLMSIRGFNNNFFFASEYLIGSFEVRAVFSDNTYFMVLFDQAYINNRIPEVVREFPTGIGTGFSLVTNSGIFNFVFALGRYSLQPFDFSLSKIHFGYIGRF
jgi:outer membrane protein assembly factor BamA